MSTTVYLATNIVNGHQYVGITTTPLKKRIYMHVWNATANSRYAKHSAFAAAIRKYGKDVFRFTVIAICEHEEAMTLERYLVNKLKPEYNVAAGGRGPSGVKWSESRRVKTIAGMLASWTDDRRNRQSEAMKGQVPVIAMEASRHVKSRNKPVVCLNDGLEFESIKMAAAHYGINAHGITAVCLGRQISTAGRRFKLLGK